MSKKSDLRKQHIIETFRNCLSNDVYSNISIEDVAKKASISKGGLRHHYPTKESLYQGVIEEFFTEFTEQISTVTEDLDVYDMQVVTTLFNFEKMLKSRENMRFMLNILQISFEDEMILKLVQKFLIDHLNLIEGIFENKNIIEKNTKLNKTKGRIIQSILLTMGIFETIAPIGIDENASLQHIVNMIREDKLNNDE